MRKIRVLVVDDHTIVRDGICALLALAPDIEVVGEAENGRGALDKVRQLAPDVVLMDMAMPVMDGLEATKIIKADPATQHIPIFALTAFAMGGDRERFIQAGCDDYLSKPYNIKELLEKVKKILGG